MLIEFADPGPPETAVSPGLAGPGGHQMRQVDFDIGLNVGSGSLEMAEAFHFIGNELIIWWVLKRQKPF